jgi:hypothetical protein
MSNGGRDPLQDAIARLLEEQAEGIQADPLTAAIGRVMSEGAPDQPAESGRGFFARTFDALTPTSPEELGLIAAGVQTPFTEGLQALFELPGFLFERDIPTDKAADFFRRLNENILSSSEQAALNAGVSPELIGDSHLLGEIFGFIAPVTASFKAARLITGIKAASPVGAAIGAAEAGAQGSVIRGVAQSVIRRNFILDSTAGAVFGGFLTPSENIGERTRSLAAQSAVFGVSGMAISGLVFAAQGMRINRARLIAGDLTLDDKLKRLTAGEKVVFSEPEAASLVQLMNEEGYLANSHLAQEFMRNLEFDNALVASVKGAAEAGQSRGLVQNFGNEFKAVDARLPAIREQFPNLKFDIIAREGPGGRTFDLHFGQTGLNNTQKAQLRVGGEGRFSGQVLNKGGSQYIYVRKGKKAGDLVVRNADGKTTTIKEKGVTNLPYAVEDIPLPTAGQALFADFREFTHARMAEAMGIEGPMTEQSIVQGLREGTLQFSDDAIRQFEIGGAITHPSELGITFRKLGNPRVMDPAATEIHAVIDETGTIWLGRAGNDAQAQQAAVIEMVMNRFGIAEQEAAVNAIIEAEVGGELMNILDQLQMGLFNPRNMRFTGQNADDLIFASGADNFAARFLAEGKYAGDILEPVAIRNMDDAFDSWVQARGLDIAAKDIEAFRANFAQRFRSDLWARLPEEDLAIFQNIREETIRLAEDGSTLALRAGAKGMLVEELEGGRVLLRDINTGASIEYGSVAIADDVVDLIVRSEKDPFNLLLSDGAHGMPGYTTGFDPTDGIFFFEEGTGKIRTVLSKGASQITHKDFLSTTPTTGIRNRRDYFDAIERLTGVPLFSEGFGAIDAASSAAALRYEPIGRRIDAAWKGISRDGRVQVAEFWTAIEGSGLKGEAMVRAAREAGLSNRQIRAFTESRKLYDLAAQELGLTESNYIPTYYSRIRPELEKGTSLPKIRALLSDQPASLQEFEFWALKQRTGELANLEMDPVIVMNKYFRALFRELEVAPLEKRMADMLALKVRDLPKAKQQEILRRGIGETTVNSHVLPDEVRAVGKEYLLNVQGQYGPGFASARRFMVRIFDKLGMNASPQIFDQFINTWLSVQYGAALGLRFATMNRNAMQNMWTMYTRVGGEFGGTSLAEAMSLRGYQAAVDAGAIRPVTASVSMGDAVFQQVMGDTFITGNGPWSNAAASGIRRGLRMGRVTRKTAETFLVPYGSGDQINRAWAYHWQRQHTEKVLNLFDAKKIDWDKFLADGLPFFSDTIRQEFRSIWDGFGREKALQFIGKQAADEAHFIYGTAASPGWMQRPFGRLFGVFGQWPLWLSELYFRRTAHATATQKIAFSVRSLSLMGLTANMGFQAGVNMWSWMAPTSLEFTGGPAVDVVEDFRALVDAPLDRKSQAGRQLASTVGSLAFPGQLFVSEIADVVGADDLQGAAFRLLLGRPADALNFAYDTSNLPEVPVDRPQTDVSGLPSIEELLERR